MSAIISPELFNQLALEFELHLVASAYFAPLSFKSKHILYSQRSKKKTLIKCLVRTGEGVHVLGQAVAISTIYT